jgi:succinate dehydrogenase / fumarate reductase cytochrome b subunit
MSTLRVPLEGSPDYHGRHGHWAYLLHRISRLGTLLFLTFRIMGTSNVHFILSVYELAIAIYRSTPFMLGEIVLVF